MRSSGKAKPFRTARRRAAIGVAQFLTNEVLENSSRNSLSQKRLHQTRLQHLNFLFNSSIFGVEALDKFSGWAFTRAHTR